MGMLQIPTANASTFPVIWVWQEKAISKWCCGNAKDSHCKAFAFHSGPKPAKGMGRCFIAPVGRMVSKSKEGIDVMRTLRTPTRVQDSTAPTRDEATFFGERQARPPSSTRTVTRTSPNKNKLHPSREPRARNPQRLPKSEVLVACSRALRAEGCVAHLQQAFAHFCRNWMSCRIGNARVIL